MLNHQDYNNVCDAVRTNVWYEFRRQKITIPFPIRTVELTRRRTLEPQEERNRARTILEGEPLFNCLTSEQLDSLLHGSHTIRFGRGERIIEQGADGTSMFVLLHGSASVAVSQNSSMIRVGGLRMGDCFGEMSLLTGERRTATVRAEEDCEVIEIAKPAMAAVLRDSPECVVQLSELLAARKMETEGLLKDAARSAAEETKALEYRATFLRRLRSVFEL